MAQGICHKQQEPATTKKWLNLQTENLTHKEKRYTKKTDNATNTTEGAQLLTGLLKDLDIYTEYRKEKRHTQGDKVSTAETQTRRLTIEYKLQKGKRKRRRTRLMRQIKQGQEQT